VLTYSYNAAQRPVSAADTSNTYVTSGSVHYAPQGVLSGGQFGQSGAISHWASFDVRLRPSLTYAHTSADILKLQFGYFGNSNVQTITNDLNPGRTLNLTYDNLNRLATAQTQATSGTYCRGQSFGYDVTYWTNLATISVTKCTAQPLGLSISNKNRITNSGFAYDDAGNLTNDGVGGAFAWNAENRLTSTAGVNYTYHGDGQRVKKSNGTLYWFRVAGEVLAETALSGDNLREFIYFAGRRIARRDEGGAVYYFFADHLGTPRAVTDPTGTVVGRHDYDPFGVEMTPWSDGETHKFTGLERDAESSLDQALFRMYASQYHRWLTPDEFRGGPVSAYGPPDPTPPGPLAYADILNPQSLNKYQYAYNNPLRYVDPTGRWPEWLKGLFKDKKNDPSPRPEPKLQPPPKPPRPPTYTAYSRAGSGFSLRRDYPAHG
jgi:RHS repeat-associated protein